MWVVTIFENEAVSMFEFNTKEEAEKMIAATDLPTVLSYTNLSFVA